MSIRQKPTLIQYAANGAAPGGFLVCDAVIDSSIEHAFDFTEHPIEDGSTITDHLVVKPEVISMTLVATQTPIYRDTQGFAVTSVPLPIRKVTYGTQTTQLDVRKRQGLPQLNVSSAIHAGIKALQSAAPSAITGLKVTGGKNAVTGSVSISVLTADAPADRVNFFYVNLLSLATQAIRVSIVFKGLELKDYVFTRVTKTDRAGEYGRSTFPVELKRVRTVQTKQVTLPAVPKAKGVKDRGAKNSGRPPPAPPEAVSRKVYQSVLLREQRGSPD